MSRPDGISCKPGSVGPLHYTPPREIGQGREIPAWGRGGFYLDSGVRVGGDSQPHGKNRQLTYREAREFAAVLDAWLTYDAPRSDWGQHGTAAEWVEAIIADLPRTLREACAVADKRAQDLRIMLAAVTGDETI